MSEPAMIIEASDSVEAVLREDLVRSDAVLATIAPVLRHLVASDDHSVFAEEVIAGVRGIVGDLARQLLGQLDGLDEEGRRNLAADRVDRLCAILAGSPALLGHVHALALEWQLGDRLQGRLAIDPVLSPMLQALIASPDETTAALAMKVLAAQSRYVQALRRMSHPLGELPGDLLHNCLLALAALAEEEGSGDRAAAAEAAIRKAYDEAATRIGLIARLVTGMGGGAVAALSVSHAGPAIFLTAMALASGQDRDRAVIATNESQLARLALALRAAGLKPLAVEEQFLALHPEVSLPEGFERLGADRAAALLAVSGGLSGY
ncbi:MAG TPA: hypothetical protein PKE25_11975 [Novosphingobium sp.]|nr:hypothetical protein [Novosphingobium sp.]